MGDASLSTDTDAQASPETFERVVHVSPAYDERDEGYGIGACRIAFILKGERGAVQFMIGTDWYLPHVQKEPSTRRLSQHVKPDGWDVGYHSRVPMHDDQPSMECDLTPEGRCFYDGSGLMADEWIPEFLAGGTEWLWPRLERQYRDMFEDSSDPETNQRDRDQ